MYSNDVQSVRHRDQSVIHWSLGKDVYPFTSVRWRFLSLGEIRCKEGVSLKKCPVIASVERKLLPLSLHQTLELVYKHLLTNQQMVAELEKVQHKPGVWEGAFFWRWPVSVSSLCAALYILIICLASSWWAFVDKSSVQTTADSSNLLATKGVMRTSLLLEQCMHAAWWYWRCTIQTVVRTVKSPYLI